MTHPEELLAWAALPSPSKHEDADGRIRDLAAALRACKEVRDRAQEQLSRAEAELDALRADADRLAWLERNPREATRRIGGNMKPAFFWGVSAAPGMSMRDAIDAARAQGEKG